MHGHLSTAWTAQRPYRTTLTATMHTNKILFRILLPFAQLPTRTNPCRCWPAATSRPVPPTANTANLRRRCLRATGGISAYKPLLRTSGARISTASYSSPPRSAGRGTLFHNMNHVAWQNAARPGVAFNVDGSGEPCGVSGHETALPGPVPSTCEVGALCAMPGPGLYGG